jgi:tRNA-2-methylthio-N6-dimethylallyladenosine synthase
MEEKIRRNQILLDGQTRRTIAINNALIGRALDVLVEGPSATNAARWMGRTRGNKVVLFDNDGQVKRGDRVTVTIGRMTPQALYGSVQDQVPRTTPVAELVGV